MMLLFNNIIKKLKIKNNELQKNADFLKTIYCPNGGGIKFAKHFFSGGKIFVTTERIKNVQTSKIKIFNHIP